MVTPAARREAVAHLQALLDVSERRACRVIGADRTVIRYRSCRDGDEALGHHPDKAFLAQDLAHFGTGFAGYDRQVQIITLQQLG